MKNEICSKLWRSAIKSRSFRYRCAGKTDPLETQRFVGTSERVESIVSCGNKRQIKIAGITVCKVNNK